MKVSAAGHSDVGHVRKSNQDSFGMSPDCGLYIVADGMGGHAGGEVASRIAVQTIQSDFIAGEATLPGPLGMMRLLTAIQHANQEIYEMGEINPTLNGMGTTVVAILADPTDTQIGFVGDSRAYLYRAYTLRQVTEDHTLVNAYIKQGLLTPEAAAHHPMRHVLNRALGTQSTVEVDTVRIQPLPEDIFLLCSDGLSNKLNEDEIGAILARSSKNLDEAALTLIEAAKRKGGEDNITVLLVGYSYR
jgi:protein phosphatase